MQWSEEFQLARGTYVARARAFTQAQSFNFCNFIFKVFLFTFQYSISLFSNYRKNNS